MSASPKRLPDAQNAVHLCSSFPSLKESPPRIDASDCQCSGVEVSTRAFAHGLLHTSFWTRAFAHELLHTRAFAHELLHTRAFAHGLIHTNYAHELCTRALYTGFAHELLYTSFCTQELCTFVLFSTRQMYILNLRSPGVTKMLRFSQGKPEPARVMELELPLRYRMV